jgi:hypothetical protein
VRLRVDHRDVGLGGAQLVGQAKSSVETDVTGAYDEDPLRIHAINATPDPLVRPV